MRFSSKDLRQLIIPLIAEQVLNVTIGMADTIMVANVGEAAISGISLVDGLNNLLIQFFIATATGGAVVTAQFLGRNDREAACRAAKQLLYTVLFAALVITVSVLLLGDRLLMLLFGSIADDVRQNAHIYFQLSALSYPFLAIYNACTALFRSMSNSRVSMKTSLMMNLSNLCGNALLIYGFHMGAAGAGIASLVSHVAAASVILVLLQNKKNPIHPDHLLSYRFDWKIVKSILYIGVPNGLENSMFQIGKVLVSSLVAMFGTSAITANAICFNFASIEIIPGLAIGLAMTTVIGQCVGAGDYKEVRHYAMKLLRLNYICMSSICIVLMFLTRPIASLYNPSPETLDLAVWIITYHAVCSIFLWPCSFGIPNILRAANDVRFPMIISTLSMWFCRILCSYLFALGFGLGLKGVWMAMTVDWTVRSICFICRYRSGKWTAKRLPD